MAILKPRRKLIVNREVQYDVLMYVGSFVAAIFVLQIITAIFFIGEVEKAVGSMNATEFISRYKVSFLVYQLVPLGISLVVGIYIFNKLTSRIAGPLYNMKRLLQKAQSGDGASYELRLREDDYFKEELLHINKILNQKSNS